MELKKELKIPLKESIVSIFGPPGIGKTTFCYQIVKENIEEVNEVFYIDTEKGFSKERFLQIFPEFERFKDKFNFFEIKNFEELNEFLRKFNSKNSLLIVDSLSMPYRLILKENLEKINQELAKTLYELLNKSENNFIVLVNHSYFLNNEHRVIGGDLIRYFSKVLIEMNFENGRRKIKILKHKFLEPKEIKFEIKKEGFKKKLF